jgi:HemY protein
MARLEQSEHEDADETRRWLEQATLAATDLAWVCRHCGNVAPEWSANCGNCGQFDGFQWSEPPHVPTLTAQLEAEPAALPPAADPAADHAAAPASSAAPSAPASAPTSASVPAPASE